ncbi:hypothetical protein TUM4249_12060 [Shewanella sp. KT0246]|nr:hypothetical protein TUM4249_12060 [Shewanella sp. KT0246]
MDFKSNKWIYFTLLVCPIILIISVYELGRLLGYLIYSDNALASYANVGQLGLFAAAIWAIGELYRTYKALNPYEQ